MSWKLGISGNEVDIPAPSGFKIDPQPIARKDRTASGKLVEDIIAVKKVFTLDYAALNVNQVQVLLIEYERSSFLSFIYTDCGIEKQAVVWFASFPRERLLTPSEYWGNFSITLEEQ